MEGAEHRAHLPKQCTSTSIQLHIPGQANDSEPCARLEHDQVTQVPSNDGTLEVTERMTFYIYGHATVSTAAHGHIMTRQQGQGKGKGTDAGKTRSTPNAV